MGSQNHAYEEIMLLPPKQFRDAPSPVSSIAQNAYEKEACAVDNILYHIYESPSKREAISHLSSQFKKDTQTLQGFVFL